jgi:Predicted integral membrane protein
MKTKNNRSGIIISSIVCLLPIILSVVVYNDLPEQIAIQWSAGENPQNFVPKAIAAFGIPLLLAVLNIFTKVRANNDPKKASISRITQLLMLWVIPVASLIIVPVALFISMGAMIPISMIVPLLAGIVFIVYGNYLPKNRQNYGIGYKIPWTLHSADNWNKTHRLAGFLWILGGVIMIVQAFAIFENAIWLTLSALIVVMVVFIPIIYSYALYRNTSDDKQNIDKNITE